MVERASELLKKAYPVPEAFDTRSFGGIDNICILGRSHFDADVSGYCTYRAIPIESPFSLPVNVSIPQAWKVALLNVNTAEASPQLMKTLSENCGGVIRNRR